MVPRPRLGVSTVVLVGSAGVASSPVLSVPPSGRRAEAASGAAVPASGMTDCETADGSLVRPAWRVAVTVNVYAVPFERPGMLARVVPAGTTNGVEPAAGDEK